LLIRITILGLIAIGAAQACMAGETVPATASPSKQLRFNIRPQPLYSALSALASQIGVQFAYTGQIVKGLTSQGVTGQHSTEQALRQILAGSGISFQFSNANTVALKKATTPVTATEPHSETTLKAMTVVKVAVQDSNDPYNKNYAVTNSTTATKTDTPIMETPMSIQVVPKSVMDDQQDTNILDALNRNVSGVLARTGGGFF